MKFKLLVIKVVFWLLDKTPELTEQAVTLLADRYLNNIQANISQDLIEIALLHAKDPMMTLTKLEAQANLPNEQLLSVLEILFNERSEIIHKLFYELSSQEVIAVTNSSIKLWLWLNQRDFSGSVLSEEELSQVIKFFPLYTSVKRARFENVVFAMLLKSEKIHMLEAFFDASVFSKPSSLRTVQKAGLLRLATKQGEKKYKQVYNMLSIENGLEKLKLSEIESSLLLDQQYRLSHQNQEQLLLNYAPKGFRHELEQYVIPVYNHLRQQMKFMDVRVNPVDKEAFTSFLEKKLIKKERLSLIRLGDGESYIWNNSTDFAVVDDQRLRERHWWGTELSEELRGNIRCQLQDALDFVDVLGIPSIYRFIRDTNPRLQNFQSMHGGRALLTVMKHLPEIVHKEVVLTEERVHQVVFDESYIKKLSNSAEKLVIVSSINEDYIMDFFGNFFVKNNIEIYKIPTHAKTLSNKIFYNNSTILPNCFNSILNNLKKETMPGTLALVAGGIIGKIFVAQLAQQGCVALDIGATVDYWVGAKTRGYGDLV